jgi:hypothetical protein
MYIWFQYYIPNFNHFPRIMRFCTKGILILRAYPDNRIVMRPSEKFEAKAAGQKGSEALFTQRREHFCTDNAGIGFCSRPQ